MTSTSPPTPPTPNQPGDDDALGPPPHDELDAMLRHWHRDNADKAAAGRDRLLASLSHEDAGADRGSLHRVEPKPGLRAGDNGGPIVVIRWVIANRYAPLAAAAVLLAALLPFLLPGKSGVVNTGLAKGPTNIVMAPEGARLDAFDDDGNLLGPCALVHTDVHAEISGEFTRVTVKQQYRNDGPEKIEAIYTCPLGEQSTVDRLKMIVGDRVITGESRERDQARRMYEEARSGGRTASVVERERPNIFTQSVANVEPGAAVDVEISYVEPVRQQGGEFSFVFPAAVSPRYVPAPARAEYADAFALPAGITPRRGLVLDAPATISNVIVHDGPGERTREQLGRMLEKAKPIAAPTDDAPRPALWYDLTAEYPDGSTEPVQLLADGRGCVGERWFYCPPTPPVSTLSATPAGQVSDAERLSLASPPETRSGQSISISVLLDTGGPAIGTLNSPHHELSRTDLARADSGLPNRISLSLASHAEIANRDFVLTWAQRSEGIASRVLTHAGDTGNFFCVQLDAPQAAPDVQAPVLTGVSATFDGVSVSDVVPDPARTQDLFVGRPITIFGRSLAPGAGSITFKGQSAQGPWSNTIPVHFPASQPDNSSLPTLWARAQVDSLMAGGLAETQNGQVNPDVRGRIIAMGEKFNIPTPFTSLLAVDDLRLTVEGKSRLVRIPTDPQEPNDWSNVFGGLPAPDRYKTNTVGLKAGAESEKHGPVLTVKEDVIGKLVTASNAQQSQVSATPPPPAPAARSSMPSVQFAIVPRSPEPTPGSSPAFDSKGPAAPPLPPAAPSAAPAAATPEDRSVEVSKKLHAEPPDQAQNGSNAHSLASPAPIQLQPDAELDRRAPESRGAAPAESANRGRDSNFYRQSGAPLQERERAPAGQSNSMPPSDAAAHAAGAADDSTSSNYSWRNGAPQGSAAARWGGSKDSTKRLDEKPAMVLDGPQLRDNSSANAANALGSQSNTDQSFFGVPVQPENLITLAAAQLAQSGRIDDAKRLACSNAASANLSSANALLYATSNMRNTAKPALVQQNISEPALDRLCGCLSGNLPAAERDAVIEESRKQASSEILERLRTETLERKLAPDAFALTPAGARASSNSSVNDQLAGEKGGKSPFTFAASTSPPPPAGPVADPATPPQLARALEQETDGPISGGRAPTLLVVILLTNTTPATLDAVKSLEARIEAVRPDANVIVARVPIAKLEDLALLEVVRRVELVPPEAPSSSSPPVR